jgi:hypothetical protein
MKRSPGQGPLQAATTGPAGQTIASWPSQGLDGSLRRSVPRRITGSSSTRVHRAASMTAEAHRHLGLAEDTDLMSPAIRMTRKSCPVSGSGPSPACSGRWSLRSQCWGRWPRSAARSRWPSRPRLCRACPVRFTATLPQTTTWTRRIWPTFALAAVQGLGRLGNHPAEHDSAQPSARQELAHRSALVCRPPAKARTLGAAGESSRSRAEDAAPRGGVRGAASVICCGLCYGVT